MRWHRRLTTTRHMKNQASDMASYLLFTVLVYWHVHIQTDRAVCFDMNVPVSSLFSRFLHKKRCPTKATLIFYHPILFPSTIFFFLLKPPSQRQIRRFLFVRLPYFALSNIL